jgi:hypothetical protein
MAPANAHDIRTALRQQFNIADNAFLVLLVGSGFKTKGYVLDNEDRPQFKYYSYGAEVTDIITVSNDGKSLSRSVNIDKPVANLYFLLANASSIEELAKGHYLVDGQSYYLELDKGAPKPIIRDANGGKEYIIPVDKQLNYSISF